MRGRNERGGGKTGRGGRRGRDIRGEEMRGKKGEPGWREGEETTRVAFSYQGNSRKREVMRQKRKLKEQEQTRLIKITTKMDKKR